MLSIFHVRNTVFSKMVQVAIDLSQPCHGFEDEILKLLTGQYSPDMNITENLCGYMVKKVYPDGKKYSNVELLDNACGGQKLIKFILLTFSIQYQELTNSCKLRV
jgi:hypothetical protein